MNFEYLVKIQKESSINVDDIGNCALDVYNDLGFEWVLLINTREGTTEIIEYGPIIPDLKVPPVKVLYTYDRMDFSEKKISHRISSFLNDGYRCVTQAFEISKNEAKDKMKSLVDYVCW